MNISGIRPEAGFYDNNSINRVNSVVNETQSSETSKSSAFDTPAVELEISVEGSARANQKFGAYDYAFQYKPGETFNMKGEDSDIKSLDVERAVSDMQRDSVLHQYQFFVGNQSSEAEPVKTENENFTL